MRKQSPHRLKYAKIAAKQILKDLVIVYMSCDDKCIVVNRRTKRIISVDSALHELITGFAYNWSILIAVYGYDADGVEYMQSDLIVAKQEYRQSDLAERLNDEHKRLISEFEGSEIIGLGWIACANGSDTWGDRSEVAFDLFKSLGAYVAPANPDEVKP